MWRTPDLGGGGGGQGSHRMAVHRRRSPPTPPFQTKVIIVGKNEIYYTKNLVGPFLFWYTNFILLGPRPPPLSPPAGGPKTVCVPELGLRFPTPLIPCIFSLRKLF